MQLVDWRTSRPGHTCIDHTYAHKRLPVRPCVPQHINPALRRDKQGDQGSNRLCGRRRYTTVSSADQSVVSQERSAVTARVLVRKLAEYLDCLKERPLPRSCSLAIYRLTVLCITEHQSEVATALAQDSRLHNGNGVFLHMVHMLQSSEDAPSQGLAADLIQAMLGGECTSLGIGLVPASAVGLTHTNAAFDVNQLLQLIIKSNHIKVKTSALLVLLLISAQDSEGAEKVLDAGTLTVALHEMLSLAGSWLMASEAEVPAGQLSGSAGHTPPHSKTAEAAMQEVMASAPFMTACQALLCRIVPRHMVDHSNYLLRLAFVSLAFSLSTSNWEMRQETAASSRSLAAKVRLWWFQRIPWLSLFYGKFFYQFLTNWATLISGPSMGQSKMLTLAQMIKSNRQAACWMMDSTAAVGIETVSDIMSAIFAYEKYAGKQQVEHSTLVRSILPALLRLLQHPSEDRRASAAESLGLLCHLAPHVVASALLLAVPPAVTNDALSILLMRLSGDDSPETRSHYAALITMCAATHDATALKKISDCGAVPYLLKLLKEAKSDDQKLRAVSCLERLAEVSHDIMTSIVVHGGTQHLLELVQAGMNKGSNGKPKLLKDSTDIALISMRALAYMLSVPASATETMKADLAGIVVEIMQEPEFESDPAVSIAAMTAAYRLSFLPAGRQQLLEKLTPASSAAMIEMSLKVLEDDNSETGGMLVADLMQLAGELTFGRQQMAQPAFGDRMIAVLKAKTRTAPQAYILPVLGMLPYLKSDGSYYPNPWLTAASNFTSSASDQLQDSHFPNQTSQVSLDAAQTSEPKPQPAAQQLLQAASARLSQQSTAEPASRDSSSCDASSASQQAQPSQSSPEQLEPHRGQGFQEALVQAAAALACKSSLPESRFQAMSWLNNLVPQLTDQGCTDVGNSEAVPAAVSLIQQESEGLKIRAVAIEFCLALHKRGFLSAGILLDADLHEQLTALVLQSDNPLGLVSLAGGLLSALWQVQPPLVTEFVSKRNLPALLRQVADIIEGRDRLTVLTLVHQVWSFTASLVSEPLLLQAIPAIVQCCGKVQALKDSEHTRASPEDLQLQADLQEEAVSLLCSMAEFPFYRPAIRKAEPAANLTSILEAGCSPDDSEQQQTIAQLAVNLIYKLLKGQRDESDGPDAPFNYSFLAAVSLHPDAAYSILCMCKRGSIESRHGALAVLQLFMTNRHGPQFNTPMQENLITLGLMPLLFGIAQAPDSTAEMRSMAETCLASVHSDRNTAMAAFGSHCLVARLIAMTLSERRAASNSDRHSR